jgi:hypothetical protein
VLCLSNMVSSHLPWNSGFSARPINVGFVADKLVHGQIVLWILWLPLSVSVHQYTHHSSITNTTQSLQLMLLKTLVSLCQLAIWLAHQLPLPCMSLIFVS